MHELYKSLHSLTSLSLSGVSGRCIAVQEHARLHFEARKRELLRSEDCDFCT